MLGAVANAAESPPALAGLTYSGDQQAIEAVDRDVRAAGNDPEKLRALEQRLLAVLRSDATYAARQAAAQRLGLILALAPTATKAEAYAPLRAMLADERESDLARLALERASGAAIDGMFLAALETTTGRARLGLLDSIGRRKAAGAVPAVVRLLDDTDHATAAAAAATLGAMGNAEAMTALQAVPEPSPPAVAAAKLAAGAQSPSRAAGIELLHGVQLHARESGHRAAAFRLSLDLEPATAVSRIAAVLSGDDAAMKRVALEALGTPGVPFLNPALIANLPSWDAPTQSAVVAALGRRREPMATRSVVAAAAHPDARVRAEAIAALGSLPGTAETAALLANFAAAAEPAEAKAARASLARLNGPDVSAAILAGGAQGQEGRRAVFLEQVALRNMQEGLPLLRRSRSDASVVVRTAGVGALGELGSPAEQKALLDWTIEATDPQEQARALRSLVSVTLRNPMIEERGRAIHALIEFAAPDLVLRLLPVLGRIGGAASANCAGRLAMRDNAKIAEAAIGVLSRWNDASALPALAAVAQKAVRPESRSAAAQGVLEYFQRHRETWTPKATAQLARVLASTTDLEVRAKCVALLHRANDSAALALAVGLQSDEALRPAAAVAADVIRANLLGPATIRASTPEGVASLRDGQTSTRWSAPSLGQEWIEIDFRLPRPLTRITLEQAGREGEFPAHYEVYVTDELNSPGEAVLSGAGQRNRTVIELPASTRGRYLILTNTAERKEAPWTVSELYVD